MRIIIALLIFSGIILFHEFGHFLLARLNGVFVIEFSLGMGPRLLSHVSRKSGTRYSLKILPFGGSCAMRGEDDGDMSEGAFGRAKVWQRLLIVAAGPFFNFLLAFLGAVIIVTGAGYGAPYAEYLSEGYPAQEAGMERGDLITSVGGEKITVYRDFSGYISLHQKDFAAGKPVTVSWIHDGESKSAELTARQSESGRYILGITGGVRIPAKNPAQVLRYSLYEVKYWISTTLNSLRLLLTGRISVQNVSGPVGVVQMIGDTYEETKSEGGFYLFLNMINLVILLSANLGVMNLLPFPALDGGRIVLLLLEAVRGKKLGENIEGYINLAGFAVLMVLMVLILINDTRKIL